MGGWEYTTGDQDKAMSNVYDIVDDISFSFGEVVLSDGMTKDICFSLEQLYSAVETYEKVLYKLVDSKFVPNKLIREIFNDIRNNDHKT